ncbi:hypothetical protein GH733_016129 [Mirounga leonina]|nr:hypothetical protein GH733_016129 [Mirounga leonina]
MALSLAFSDAFLVAEPSDPETQMAFLRTDEQSHLGSCQQGSLDKRLLACVFEMVPHSPDVTMAAHQTEEESWWEK